MLIAEYCHFRRCHRGLNARLEKKQVVALLAEQEDLSGDDDSYLHLIFAERGYGFDWLDYENKAGYTHFEELLIFQHKNWKQQAREYLYRFHCNPDRVCSSKSGTVLRDSTTVYSNDNLNYRTFELPLQANNETEKIVPIFLYNPVLAVLFHPEIKRVDRYQPYSIGRRLGIPSFNFRTVLPVLLPSNVARPRNCSQLN